MIKKILFIFFMFTSVSFVFSQENSVSNLVASPNPFTSQTTITFDSAEEQGVYLVVKNVLGKTVYKKAFYTDKGKRNITFKRNELKAGVYIYAIQSSKNSISKRFVIK